MPLETSKPPPKGFAAFMKAMNGEEETQQAEPSKSQWAAIRQKKTDEEAGAKTKDCARAFLAGFMPIATGRAFDKISKGEEPSALESGILGALDFAVPRVPYIGDIVSFASRAYQAEKIKQLQDKGIYILPQKEGETDIEKSALLGACMGTGIKLRYEGLSNDIYNPKW